MKRLVLGGRPHEPGSAQVVSRPRHRWPRALCFASATSVAVYTAMVTGHLDGTTGLLFAGLLIVMMPVAPTLTRRVALNGTLVMGWSPAIWMVRWPGQLNHGALLCAVAAGTIVALVLLSDSPRSAARELLPRARAIDLTWVVAGSFAFVTMRLWMLASTPQEALAQMLRGYDNNAHFDIFRMIRVRGTTMDLLGPSPDGTDWAFGHYPQAFHSLIATMADIANPAASSAPEDLLLYAHMVAGGVILGTIVLVSALASLQLLSDRPWVVIPAASVVITAFLWKPGASVIADGFANFWFGSVFAACALVLAMSWAPDRSVALVGAVGGALFAAALTWPPLGLLALPAALVVWPRCADWMDAEKRRWVSLFLLVLSSMGFAKAGTLILGAVTVKTLVDATGQISGTSPAPVILLALTCIYTCVAVPGLARRSRSTVHLASMRRTRLLALTPVAGGESPRVVGFEVPRRGCVK